MEVLITQHLDVVKHIICYIVGARHHVCLCARKNVSTALVGYSNSDMVNDVDTCNSITNMLFLLGKIIVSWKLEIQKLVTFFSCVAEYMAVTMVAKMCN